MDGIIQAVSMLVGLSILVVVHESGHYLAARAFKMKVLVYSIGFGPTIFKHKPKGSDTTFQVAAIPFLAYVQIAGMNPYEEHEPDAVGLFDAQSLTARVVTVAAGPFANYLTAFILALGIGLVGWPAGTFRAISPDDPRVQVTVPATAGRIMEDSPAAEAGVEPGDTITSVAGVTINDFDQLREQTQLHGDESVEYIVSRGGEELTLTLTPTLTDGEPRIGIMAAPVHMEPIQLGIGEAAALAAEIPWRLTVLQLSAIKNMIVRLDSSGLGGPVKIAEQFGEAAKSGPIAWLITLMMMSVALGLFNLLPFPALDGGRLVFLALEAITRRKPNPKIEVVVHTVGIVFLLCVVALVTLRDVGQYGEGELTSVRASASMKDDGGKVRVDEPAAPE